MSNYSELLRDPRWQKRRLQIMDRDQYTCQRCFSDTKPLNVHHRIYYSGHNPWEYGDIDLVTLCEDCHKYESDNLNAALKNLSDVIRSLFLSDDIRKLTIGFSGLDTSIGSDVLASVIKEAFLNRQQSIYDEYIFQIEQKSESNA